MCGNHRPTLTRRTCQKTVIPLIFSLHFQSVSEQIPCKFTPPAAIDLLPDSSSSSWDATVLFFCNFPSLTAFEDVGNSLGKPVSSQVQHFEPEGVILRCVRLLPRSAMPPGCSPGLPIRPTDARAEGQTAIWSSITQSNLCLYVVRLLICFG
jgi:hypothetical protein